MSRSFHFVSVESLIWVSSLLPACEKDCAHDFFLLLFFANHKKTKINKLTRMNKRVCASVCVCVCSLRQAGGNSGVMSGSRLCFGFVNARGMPVMGPGRTWSCIIPHNLHISSGTGLSSSTHRFNMWWICASRLFQLIFFFLTHTIFSANVWTVRKISARGLFSGGIVLPNVRGEKVPHCAFFVCVLNKAFKLQSCINMPRHAPPSCHRGP